MKKSLPVVLAATFVLTLPAMLHAEPENSVNFGADGLVQLMKNCRANVYIVEYERLIGQRISVLGRGTQVSYRFDDGQYREQGRPKGVDVGLRIYPAGSMKGFFVGGSLGYWMADWTFTSDRGSPGEAQGRGDTNSIRANVDMGVRVPIGSPALSIMPVLNFGRFFSSTSCEYTGPPSRVGAACSQDTEVQYYIYLAVMAGFAF